MIEIKFLDARLLLANRIISTEVYCKPKKFPVHWKSQILKRYQRNAINENPNKDSEPAKHQLQQLDHDLISTYG